MLLLSTLPTFDLVSSRDTAEFDVARAVDAARHRRWELLEKPALRELDQQSEALFSEEGGLEEGLEEGVGSEYFPEATSRMRPRRQLLEELVWQPGSFKIDLQQMTAAKPSNILVELRMCIACKGILPGEVIELVLPEFTRAPQLQDNPILPSMVTGEVGSISTVIWDEPATTLTFVAARLLSPGRIYRINVPLSAGIILPERGVSSETGIMVSTTSQSGGPAEPIPVEGIAPVGSFMDSTELDFEPSTAGAAVRMVLRFLPEMEIGIDEHVVLDLPNFFCVAGAPCEYATFSSILVVTRNGTQPVTTTIKTAWRSVPLR